MDPHKTIIAAMENANSYLTAIAKEQQNTKLNSIEGRATIQNEQTIWVPPTLNQIKINVDAATTLDQSRGAYAVIIRNHEGVLLTGASRRIPCCSAIEAEAQAVIAAIYMAESLGLQDVIIKTDCKEVSDLCSSTGMHWKISTCIDEIRSLLAKNSSYSVNWVRRSANKVAHLAANMAINFNLPSLWTWFTPVKIRAALLEDVRVWQSSPLRLVE